MIENLLDNIVLLYVVHEWCAINMRHIWPFISILLCHKSISNIGHISLLKASLNQKNTAYLLHLFCIYMYGEKSELYKGVHFFLNFSLEYTLFALVNIIFIAYYCHCLLLQSFFLPQIISSFLSLLALSSYHIYIMRTIEPLKSKQ